MIEIGQLYNYKHEETDSWYERIKITNKILRIENIKEGKVFCRFGSHSGNLTESKEVIIEHFMQCIENETLILFKEVPAVYNPPPPSRLSRVE